MPAWLRRHEFGLLLTIAVVITVSATLDSQHKYVTRPYESSLIVLRQTALLGTFALGAAIVIISGGIDLSAGAVIAFSGTICLSILHGLAPNQLRAGGVSGSILFAAIGGTLLTGFLIGSLHAWLITVIRLPPFVATLATLVGLRSLARAVVEGVARRPQINVDDAAFRSLASVHVVSAIFVVLGLAAWFVMAKTVLGRHLYALGGNEQAAHLSGLRTDRLKWFAYSASAMLASLAGILHVADQAVANPQMLGQGYELNGIAAAVVGGCSLQGGVGTIPGVMLGTLFLRLVIDAVAIVIKQGADTYQGMIVGLVVVLAVAVNSARRSGEAAPRYFSGGLGFVVIVAFVLLAALLAGIFGPTLAASLTGIPPRELPGWANPGNLSRGAGLLTLLVLVLLRFREGKR